MKRQVFLAVVLTLTFFVSSPGLAGEVVVPVDHYPPWKIVKGREYRGIDVELTRILLREVDLTPRFDAYPWSRGLQMLRDGDADLISGILKRPDREKDLIFIEPPYKTRSSKVFFIRKGAVDIVHYEDLKGFRIGLQRGARYFKRFDEDISLDKQVVNDDVFNFRKLVSGRIDAVVITESIGDYMAAELGVLDQVRKASFRYEFEIPVYFALSRKSKFAERAQDFMAAAKRLKESGEFDRVIAGFFQRLKTGKDRAAER